jgi:hypothetical protein
MITHAALVATIAGCNQMLEAYNETLRDGDSYLSFLPLAHVFDRLAEEFMLNKGGCVGYWQVCARVPRLRGLRGLAREARGGPAAGSRACAACSACMHRTPNPEGSLGHTTRRARRDTTRYTAYCTAHTAPHTRAQGEIPKVLDDIVALRPSLFCGVPRVFDRIFAGINEQVWWHHVCVCVCVCVCVRAELSTHQVEESPRARWPPAHKQTDRRA